MKKKSFLMTAVATISLVTATMAQNVPSYVPTNGLVGWWPFNGNANDESGNGHNGTVNGATLTIDRFGNANKAYSFDGINDFIDIGDLDATENIISLTFSFWVKPNNLGIGTSSGRKPLISKWNSLPGFPGECSYNFLLADTLIRITYKDVLDTARISEFKSLIDIGSWNNILILFNQGIVKYYLNGNLLGQNTVPVNQIYNSTRNLKFGDWYHTENTNYSTFDGYIDDIGVWNRALTPQEITNLYNGNICYQYVTVTDTLLINTNITGFNPITYQNTIKIFPNPTNDHITINYGNFASLNGYQLKITNSLGQQMFQTTINQQSSYISLASWTGNGLYFVHIIDPQGNTIDIRKIVLQ